MTSSQEGVLATRWLRWRASAAPWRPDAAVPPMASWCPQVSAKAGARVRSGPVGSRRRPPRAAAANGRQHKEPSLGRRFVRSPNVCPKCVDARRGPPAQLYARVFPSLKAMPHSSWTFLTTVSPEACARSREVTAARKTAVRKCGLLEAGKEACSGHAVIRTPPIEGNKGGVITKF